MTVPELSQNAQRVSHLQIYEGRHEDATDVVRAYLQYRWGYSCNHAEGCDIVDALRAHKKALEAAATAAAASPECRYRVTLTTLARMTGVRHVRARSEEEARAKVMGTLGDTAWDYDGCCEEPGQGPEIQSVEVEDLAFRKG